MVVSVDCRGSEKGSGPALPSGSKLSLLSPSSSSLFFYLETGSHVAKPFYTFCFEIGFHCVALDGLELAK